MTTLFRILSGLLLALLACGCTSPAEQPSDTESLTADSAISTADNESAVQNDPTEGLELGDPEKGREYFYGENRGRCLDCHTLGAEGNNRGYDGQIWALDDTGLRHDAEWIATFIFSPRTLRPEVARMPPWRGDSKGATIADIVAFLMTLKTPIEHPPYADVKPEDEPDPDFSGVGNNSDGHSGPD